MNIIMLMNVKMPTIVGILTFIYMINRTSETLKATHIFVFCILVFMNTSIFDLYLIEIIDNCCCFL